MLPYWILFVFFAVGAALDPRRREGEPTRINFVMLIGALATAFFVGMRFEVGSDWFTYEYLYKLIEHRSLEKALQFGDPGYQFVSWVFIQGDYDIWAVNLVCSSIFMWGLYRLCQNQPLPLLAMLVAVPYLIIVVAMGYTRQSAAIGFAMAGFASLERGGSLLRFSVYALLAATFHKTAIAVLPVAIFSNPRNRIMNLLGGVAIGVSMYTALLADSVDHLIKNYIDAEYQSQGALIRVMMNVIPAIIMLRFGKLLNFERNEKRFWTIMSLAAFAALFALFLSPSSTAVDRIALYILPLQVAVIPRAVFLFKSIKMGKIFVIAYSAFVLFVWMFFAQHSSGWLPYEFFPL